MSAVYVWSPVTTKKRISLVRVDDSRRLTGPNLFGVTPGAVCDVLAKPDEQLALIDAWSRHLPVLLEAVGWSGERMGHRGHATGVSLFVTAPRDALYAATDVNEAAVARAIDELAGNGPSDLPDAVARLKSLIDEETDPSLLALIAEAESRAVPLLVDEDHLSVGFGRHAQVYATNELPDVDDVPWQDAGTWGDIPVALVTGTNGKSTTVRLAASIVSASGKTAGVTSTDYIRVGEHTIDRGDYSGPGGARQLLRHADTDLALLEVARGGMLRRGLGVTNADAALVTNVAADHLGEYGIDTVADLRECKFVVRLGLAPDKPLVLNADDDGVVAFSESLADQTCLWFGESSTHPVLQSAIAAGNPVYTLEGGALGRKTFSGFEAIVDVAAIPVTMGGAARHNVQNALAAAALTAALGCDDAAIGQGLLEFDGGPDANPGRGNLFTGRGITAIVDFAHNEHGLRAMADSVARLPAKRRLVLLGQAGDRSDDLIAGLTEAALSCNPDQLVVCQLPGYERGRAADEVPKLIEAMATSHGLAPSAIHHAASPVDGTRFALDWASDGDVLLILALTQRGPCTQLIERYLGT
ncbi:MAG: Mur ligase family protein [Pseudomonadota bacterium]